MDAKTTIQWVVGGTLAVAAGYLLHDVLSRKKKEKEAIVNFKKSSKMFTVFCGSRIGNHENYSKQAEGLAERIDF